MGPADLTDEERAALEDLLFRLADDEFVLAERYVEWQVHAPTLESDLAVANVAQDEYGHARLWYDLLEDFGYDQDALVFERDPDQFRHATLVELPFASGDWADAVLRGYLYDEAERLRLEALSESGYDRIADRVEKIRGEEEYHREHAQSWLERLADGDESRERLQDALDRLFPYALTLFAPTAREDAVVECGFRTATLDDLRADWLDVTVPFLESLGLTVPDPPEDRTGPPVDRVGRDGDHTDAWSDLHAEYTRTYDSLDRAKGLRLLEDPDEVTS